jgi:hypothetical protein
LRSAPPADIEERNTLSYDVNDVLQGHAPLRTTVETIARKGYSTRHRKRCLGVLLRAGVLDLVVLPAEAICCGFVRTPNDATARRALRFWVRAPSPSARQPAPITVS